MTPEIEAKFLDVDQNAIRAKLKALGAECVQPMRAMRRKNYDFPDKSLEGRGGWVRVRDEGDKVTLAYKQLHDRSLTGTHEVSMTVSDFESADAFLKAIGLEVHSYQETKRESWRLDDVEIELDEWPWVKPYLEIEGPSEEHVKDLATKLGLAWEDACHGSVEVVYQAEYDVTDKDVDDIAQVTFELPVPEVLASRRR